MRACWLVQCALCCLDGNGLRSSTKQHRAPVALLLQVQGRRVPSHRVRAVEECGGARAQLLLR